MSNNIAAADTVILVLFHKQLPSELKLIWELNMDNRDTDCREEFDSLQKSA